MIVLNAYGEILFLNLKPNQLDSSVLLTLFIAVLTQFYHIIRIHRPSTVSVFAFK